MARIGAFAAAMTGVIAAPASAESWFSGEWTITVGAEAHVVPVFEGAESFGVIPRPIFSVRRAGTLARFGAPDDGLRFGLVETPSLRIGPAARIKGARRESASTKLSGLGNVGPALEAGIFAEYWVTENVRLGGELRHGIGGHSGILADLGADLVLRPVTDLTLSIGPRLALSNAAYNRTYFGVTPSQAAASGLPAYRPGGGARSVGLVGGASYGFHPNWTLSAFARYDRLLGDVAASPLVRRSGSRDQFSAGLGLAYSFDVTIP